MSAPLLLLPPLLQRFARLFFVIGALVLVLSASIMPAAPATAHDQVISTTPAEGEHRDTAPAEVSMTFTSEILELGAIMLVVDTDGENWAIGKLTLEGSLAVQPVSDTLPDGAYQVRWRVVSADGHPIAGTVNFTVGTVTATDTATDNATDAAADPSSASATAPPVAADGVSASHSSDVSLWLMGLLGALAGVGVYALVLLWRRPRRTGTPAAAPPAAPLTAPSTVHSTTTSTPPITSSENGL